MNPPEGTFQTYQGDKYTVDRDGCIELVTDTGWHELRDVNIFLTRKDLVEMIHEIDIATEGTE